MAAPLFSIIFTYRNRDVARLEACLQSLMVQYDAPTYEVILIDSGSTSEYEGVAKALCERLGGPVRYLFVPTMGQPWNKSLVLNLAVDKALGQTLIFGDIDLIYPPYFLARVLHRARPGLKLNYRCRYLPSNVNTATYRELAKPYAQAPISTDTGLGLSVVAREDFERIGGYDERFILWGIEDVAFHEHAVARGLDTAWIDADQICTFHLWHPKLADELPKNWYDTMWTYYQQTFEAGPVRYDDWGSITHRPLLHTELMPAHTVLLNVNIIAHTHQFYQLFEDAAPGDCLVMAADRHGLKTHPIVQQLNDRLSRLGIQYRMQAAQLESGMWEPEEKYLSTMLYFLLYNRGKLADFTLRQGKERTELIVVKR